MNEQAPRLEILDGEGKGTQFRLLGETALIGRSPECDILLPEGRGVSRRHAQLFLDGGRIRIKDLESQNGTFVDGGRVSEAVCAAGCTIKIGQVSLRLLAAESAPLAASGPRPPAAARASSRAAVPASSGGPLAAEPIEPLDSESLVASAGQGSRGAFWAVSLLALIIGGSYALSALLAPTAASIPNYRILQVNEARVYGVAAAFTDIQPSGSSMTEENIPLVAAEPYRGMLKSAVEEANTRNRRNGGPELHLLQVQGQARGNATLLLRGSGGEVGRVQVLVRGIKEQELPTRLPAAEARERAEQYLRQAKTLEDNGQRYESMQAQEKAYSLFKSFAGDARRANKANEDALKLRDRLQDETGRLFLEAVALAWPDRAGLSAAKPKQAFLALETAKRLIRDEESPDWQAIDLWQALVRRAAGGQ